MYLKQNHQVLYVNLLTSVRLNAYLASINEDATDMFLRLVKEIAEKENVIEKFKATEKMLWAQIKNNICNRAKETVSAEMIYA